MNRASIYQALRRNRETIRDLERRGVVEIQFQGNQKHSEVEGVAVSLRRLRTLTRIGLWEKVGEGFYKRIRTEAEVRASLKRPQRVSIGLRVPQTTAEELEAIAVEQGLVVASGPKMGQPNRRASIDFLINQYRATQRALATFESPPVLNVEDPEEFADRVTASFNEVYERHKGVQPVEDMA